MRIEIDGVVLDVEETKKYGLQLVLEKRPEGRKVGGLQFGIAKARAIAKHKDAINAHLRGDKPSGYEVWDYNGDRCLAVPVESPRTPKWGKGLRHWTKVMAYIREIETFVKLCDERGVQDKGEAA